jgi:hypothetical protein
MRAEDLIQNWNEGQLQRSEIEIYLSEQAAAFPRKYQHVQEQDIKHVAGLFHNLYIMQQHYPDTYQYVIGGCMRDFLEGDLHGFIGRADEHVLRAAPLMVLFHANVTTAIL